MGLLSLLGLLYFSLGLWLDGTTYYALQSFFSFFFIISQLPHLNTLSPYVLLLQLGVDYLYEFDDLYRFAKHVVRFKRR